MKSLILLILLIGIGLNAVSQTFEITANQLKQIRLLENNYKRDSTLLVNCNKKNKTLNFVILTQHKNLKYSEQQIKTYKSLVLTKDTLIENKMKLIDIAETETKRIRKKLIIRTFILSFSAAGNVFFIYKLVK